MPDRENIIGLWESATKVDGEPIGALKFLFLPDMTFGYFEQNLSALPNGLELGSYELKGNDVIYDLLFDGIRNLGSDSGLSESVEKIVISSTASDRLVLDLGPYNGVEVRRVDIAHSGKELKGLWKLKEQKFATELSEKNDAYLIFSNSTFWVLDYGEAPAFKSFDGLEYGTYEFDNTSYTVSFDFKYNGTQVGGQDVGLSNRGPEVHVEFENDNKLIMTFPSEEKLTLFFERVELNSETNMAERVPPGTYSLTIIAEVFGNGLVLQDLSEIVTETEHYVIYNGTRYDYEDVNPYIMTVSRDNEFTEEFSLEIKEAFPESAGISYGFALSLVGLRDWENALLTVANHDGLFVS